MFTLKETFIISLKPKGTKKVKGALYFSSSLNRELFIHTDVDNEKYTSISDRATGYRLFNFAEKYDKIKEEDIEERINKFIQHYSMSAIEEEFKRVEGLVLR